MRDGLGETTGKYRPEEIKKEEERWREKVKPESQEKMQGTKLRDAGKKGFQDLGPEQWGVSGKTEARKKEKLELTVIEGGKKIYHEPIFLNEQEKERALKVLEKDKEKLGASYDQMLDTVLNRATFEQLEKKYGASSVPLTREQFDTLLGSGKIKREELEVKAHITIEPKLSPEEMAQADLALFKSEGKSDLQLSLEQLRYLKSKIFAEKDEKKKKNFEASFEKLTDNYLQGEAEEKLRKLSNLRSQMSDKQLSQEFRLINLEKTLNKALITGKKQDISQTQFVQIESAILDQHGIRKATELIKKAETLLNVSEQEEIKEEAKVLKLKEIMSLAKASRKKQRITVENYDQLVQVITGEAKTAEEMIEGIENLDKITEVYDPEEEAKKKIAAREAENILTVAKYFDQPKQVTPYQCQALLEKWRDEYGDEEIYQRLPELRKYFRVRDIFSKRGEVLKPKKEEAKTKAVPPTKPEEIKEQPLPPEEPITKTNVIELTPEYEIDDSGDSKEEKELKREGSSTILEFIERPNNKETLGFGRAEFKKSEDTFREQERNFKNNHGRYPEQLGSITRLRLRYGILLTKAEKQMKSDLESYQKAKKEYEEKIRAILKKTPEAVMKNKAYIKLADLKKAA